MTLQTQIIKELASPNAYNEYDLYLNGTTGNDNNDGLTLTTPKQTLLGIKSVIADLYSPNGSSQYFGVHVRGTLATIPENNIVINGHRGLNIVFDGGPDLTQVGGPFTVTTADKFTLTSSGASWTADDWKGYVAECTAGSETGRQRLCSRSGADTLEVCRMFPTTGVTQVTLNKYTTQFGDGSGACNIGIKVSGGGYVFFNRFTVNDPLCSFKVHAGGTLCLSALTVLDGKQLFLDILSAYGWFKGDFLDIESHPFTAKQTPAYANGVGMIKGKDLDVIDRMGSFVGASCVFGKLTRFISYNQCEHGTRIKQLYIRMGLRGVGLWIQSDTGTTTVDGSSGVGFTVDHGQAYMSGGATRLLIQNHASHAIEVKRGGVLLNCRCGGSNNGGAGAYFHTGASGNYNSGATVTGTVGEFSVDGVTQYDTWVNIEPLEKIAIADHQVGLNNAVVN